MPRALSSLPRWITCLLAGALALACGGAGANAAPVGAPDAPVAAQEPRATLVADVDLPRGAECAQTFDLALYEDRSIVLVEWGGAPDTCRARRVKVTFLSKRTTQDAVLERMKKRAERVALLPSTSS
jgi:hypothetical protein